MTNKWELSWDSNITDFRTDPLKSYIYFGHVYLFFILQWWKSKMISNVRLTLGWKGKRLCFGHVYGHHTKEKGLRIVIYRALLNMDNREACIAISNSEGVHKPKQVIVYELLWKTKTIRKSRRDGYWLRGARNDRKYVIQLKRDLVFSVLLADFPYWVFIRYQYISKLYILKIMNE